MAPQISNRTTSDPLSDDEKAKAGERFEIKSRKRKSDFSDEISRIIMAEQQKRIEERQTRVETRQNILTKYLSMKEGDTSLPVFE